MPIVAWNPWNDMRERQDVQATKPPFPFGPLPQDYQKLVRQHYYAAVSYVDDLIGQLLDGMISSKRSFLNDTTIVLVGDHGWSLGEHGEWAKYSNFEVATQVPLLVYSLI